MNDELPDEVVIEDDESIDRIVVDEGDGGVVYMEGTECKYCFREAIGVFRVDFGDRVGHGGVCEKHKERFDDGQNDKDVEVMHFG